MSYVDAGYSICLTVLFLYGVSLILRRRRLLRAAAIAERDAANRDTANGDAANGDTANGDATVGPVGAVRNGVAAVDAGDER